MAIFNWTAQADGALIPFDPTIDQFVFDDTGISATGVEVAAVSAGLGFQFGGKLVVLTMHGLSATSTNVTFADGSQLIVGDNTTGTTDNGSNVLVGSSGVDHLLGLGGNDTLLQTTGADRIDGGADSDVLDFTATGIS